MKFRPKFIGVTKNPVIIVGQNPGPKHGVDSNDLVWEKGRASALLLSIIDETSNVILTNVCNYREMTPENIMEGEGDLFNLIQEYEPRKIICLGDVSYQQVNEVLKEDPWLYQLHDPVKLPHPSYIMRFNKSKSEYRSRLLEEMYAR